MKASETWRLAIIILIALTALFVDLNIDHPRWVENLLFWRPEDQREIDLRLGLDLQGGLQVLLSADPPEGQEFDPASMETARRIVENRVNSLGLTEPVVQAQGERRIIVELPGVEDPEQAVETIKGTALLEFVDAGVNPLAPDTVITTSLGAPTEGQAEITATEASTPAGSETETLPTEMPLEEVGATEEARDYSPVPETPAERHELYEEPPAMAIEPDRAYTATIATEEGDIVVRLDAQAAPRTVNNFVFLAREGFYDGLTFHRVEDDFVIQGGDPLGTGEGGPGYTVPAEIGLKHIEGAIAMARRGDDVNPERASSGSQFYITLDETSHLDGAYTVFGQVIAGMDVVQSIEKDDLIEGITIEESATVVSQAVTEEATPSGASQTAPEQSASPGTVYETILTGADLANVGLDRTDRGEYVIPFELQPEAAQTFAEYTSANVGRFLCIVLDKQVISCPRVNQPIVEGRGMIQGDFTLDSAQQLAVQLRYGALPMPLRVESFNRVGATLGQESVERSVRAGIIGLGIVLLFMLVYYRLPGGLADLALTIYVLINFALYKLMPITLTLPGIAGFILSAGMAVDANILIFERMKEELRQGRSVPLSIRLGFDRAWPSIRDSQASELLICVILFFFGSNFGASSVKGFAITLAIGSLVNIFTAVFATRTFVHHVAVLAGDWLAERKWLLGV